MWLLGWKRTDGSLFALGIIHQNIPPRVGDYREKFIKSPRAFGFEQMHRLLVIFP